MATCNRRDAVTLALNVVVGGPASKVARSRFFVVRLDVNDKDGDRSLKMGKSGAFSFKAGTSPDSDWTYAFDAAEEKKGSWKVTLRKPLAAGEYGVYEVQS